jgi:pantetheine-phosphate adenylyltransferase
MKIGFYPGSFNPWHDGHSDVLAKALKVFDRVVILQLTNPEKTGPTKPLEIPNFQSGIEIIQRKNTFLFIVIGNYVLGHALENHQYAIIRGLRTGQDLEYEKVQQYTNEDLGMKIPTVYFLADRNLTHVSSSVIRAIDKFQAEEEKRRKDEQQQLSEMGDN